MLIPTNIFPTPSTLSCPYTNKMSTRLNKFIANNTDISRRKADEMISKGEIKINNKLVEELGTMVDEEKDRITVNGRPLIINRDKIYIALNKPAGYITTRDDEMQRKTVMDLVPKNKNLKPVGRLDKETEGLLILTNDGNLIYKYTHPKFHCEKEYKVLVKGELNTRNKEKLERGVVIEGKKTAPCRIQISKSSETATELKITIYEGRKRQIRKMFAEISHPVKYLQRIRIGKINLGFLKKGEFRLLNKNELVDAFQSP